MQIEFDPVKNASNITEHGLAFELAAELNLRESYNRIDNRFDYGEERWISLGVIRGRLHAMAYKFTTTGIRVISLRKANEKEQKIYDEASH